MAWVFGVAAVTLGIIALWGLLAPRNQWRVLSSWSVSDPHTHEPGRAAYTARRLASGLALVGIAVVGIVGAAPSVLAQLPRDTVALTPVQIMWGTPEPQLVSRDVHPLASPPAGLVEFPILGYQNLDALDDLPTYLLDMRHFSLLGKTNIPGYIGSIPAEGFSAVGPADLVVHVRGPVLCIPREAVVIETETTVQIGIYYGLPDPTPVPAPTPTRESDDSNDDEDTPVVAEPAAPDHVAGCRTDDPVTGSVLIPIVLGDYLGDRKVQMLDGTAIERIRLSE